MTAGNFLFLHEKQMEVYRAKSRFKVVVAGRRWGKTQLAKTSMIRFANVRNRLIWYVAPSYRMAKQIMWPELLAALPRRWVKKINETSMTVTLVNNTRLELKGADNPDSLRGVGVHYLVMDEVQDIHPEAWTKVLRPTLASTNGQALFIGTPKAYNFLYELYALGQKPENRASGKWISWQFPTITSPFIPPDEIAAAMEDMDEKSFNQEFNASFETMSGRVYHPFDRRIHLRACKFDPSKPIWVGQDFNIDPMSSVIIQQQDDGTLWAIDEVVLRGSNTEEVCDELDRRYWRYIDNVVLFPDPAGAYRQHARGESDLDIFRERGFKRQRYHRKHPPIADRVNAVNRMLKSADGTVRFYIDPKCKHLIASLEQTIYKKGTREIDKDADIEHSGDAAGYLIHYQFPVRKVQIAGKSI
ncbi:terminase large subunit domain-containing protein [Achromobacter sp. AGC39]